MKLADYPGKRGVTLVEVLVVVTIMALQASGAPS